MSVSRVVTRPFDADARAGMRLDSRGSEAQWLGDLLVGTFVGASLLKEAVKPSQVAGAAIMLLGVIGLVWA